MFVCLGDILTLSGVFAQINQLHFVDCVGFLCNHEMDFAHCHQNFTLIWALILIVQLSKTLCTQSWNSLVLISMKTFTDIMSYYEGIHWLHATRALSHLSVYSHQFYHLYLSHCMGMIGGCKGYEK